ncbi:MAG TPA: anthranilate phosphoribosyltransferase [Jiangellales bacterium]|nr:anthranilate phosphoribosyltransferase [Jiangellales bacterium]
MNPQSWPQVLTALLERTDLPAAATAWAMGEIMDGSATSAQIAAFVIALRAKGETVDEVSGLVSAMYERSTPISVPGRAVDVVGTGGDRAHTVNISTMAAIVAAGAGVQVVKHGNRAASSACGAADLLEELGIDLSLPPDRVARIAEEVGITFCFAALFHPALRHAGATRRELGIPTTFNFLGPLANPARPAAQAVGVADARMAAIIAGVLAERGVSALVFRGDDGLDELTTTTTSRVWVVRDGEVHEERIDPVDLGIPPSAPGALRGGDASYNADVARRFLAGEPGPVRDAVLLNAAAALVAYDGPSGPAKPLAQQIGEAFGRARGAVDSGEAAAVLDRWIAAC